MEARPAVRQAVLMTPMRRLQALTSQVTRYAKIFIAVKIAVNVQAATLQLCKV
jgi:hypothetical protein